jgi:hypothetical protein
MALGAQTFEKLFILADMLRRRIWHHVPILLLPAQNPREAGDGGEPGVQALARQTCAPGFFAAMLPAVTACQVVVQDLLV